MAPVTDPSSVGRSDEHALRRFLTCRRAGDEAGAAAAWTAVVEQEHDRLRAIVAAWGRRGGRLSHAEQEEAYAMALTKFALNMQATFRGTSMGELVNAVRSCAEYACLEVRRTAARHSQRHTPFEVAGDDGELRLSDGVAKGLAREHSWAQADEAEAEADAAERAFLDWALPRIPNDRHRAAVEQLRAGVPAEQTAERLGVTMDNLYQLRTRGTKALHKLKEQWDG